MIMADATSRELGVRERRRFVLADLGFVEFIRGHGRSC
jgi:hypothetical protein